MNNLIPNEAILITAPKNIKIIDQTSATRLKAISKKNKSKRKQASNLTMNKMIQKDVALNTKPQEEKFKNETPYTISKKNKSKRQKQKYMQYTTSFRIENQSRSNSLPVEFNSMPKHKIPLRSNSSPNTTSGISSNAFPSFSNVTNENIFSSQLTKEPESYEENINKILHEEFFTEEFLTEEFPTVVWASDLIGGINYPTSYNNVQSVDQNCVQEFDTTNLCCSPNYNIITELFDTSSTSYHASASHDINRMYSHNE
ncbi:9448_t:CDS:1 [Racocetra fulgida]|uniref:9448_t:CDS:1 n=1 Tax=Racocetra fulgida TaxID=60492 RepID=A0A9N9FL37_9GLOM|nr:9448_t:CDS:1 [Racocetra fulgida]